jgi:hypothetical protein
MLSFLMLRMFDHGSNDLLSFFDGHEQKKRDKVLNILAAFILRRENKYMLGQLKMYESLEERVKAGAEGRSAGGKDARLRVAIAESHIG